MARIYVASSWKNMRQPWLVEELRNRGHEVYDFRHPAGRDDENVWNEVSKVRGLAERYRDNSLTADDFLRMIGDERARQRFHEHMSAMREADTCVLLLPSGRSAHVEAGYMAAMGKRVIVLDVGQRVRPELMYGMFHSYTADYVRLCELIENDQEKQGHGEAE